MQKVWKRKGFVGKGCWKWGIREKDMEAQRDGILVLGDRWKEVEMVPSLIISFPSHALQKSVLKILH